jgi:hypothetical protein
MGAALRVQARFQAVFGKPFADDPVRHWSTKPLPRGCRWPQYAERKYNFAAESGEKQRHAEVQARIDAGVICRRDEVAGRASGDGGA